VNVKEVGTLGFKQRRLREKLRKGRLSFLSLSRNDVREIKSVRIS